MSRSRFYYTGRKAAHQQVQVPAPGLVGGSQDDLDGTSETLGRFSLSPKKFLSGKLHSLRSPLRSSKESNNSRTGPQEKAKGVGPGVIQLVGEIAGSNEEGGSDKQANLQEVETTAGGTDTRILIGTSSRSKNQKEIKMRQQLRRRERERQMKDEEDLRKKLDNLARLLRQKELSAFKDLEMQYIKHLEKVDRRSRKLKKIPFDSQHKSGTSCNLAKPQSVKQERGTVETNSQTVQKYSNLARVNQGGVDQEGLTVPSSRSESSSDHRIALTSVRRAPEAASYGDQFREIVSNEYFLHPSLFGMYRITSGLGRDMSASKKTAANAIACDVLSEARFDAGKVSPVFFGYRCHADPKAHVTEEDLAKSATWRALELDLCLIQRIKSPVQAGSVRNRRYPDSQKRSKDGPILAYFRKECRRSNHGTNVEVDTSENSSAHFLPELVKPSLHNDEGSSPGPTRSSTGEGKSHREERFSRRRVKDREHRRMERNGKRRAKSGTKRHRGRSRIHATSDESAILDHTRLASCLRLGARRHFCQSSTFPLILPVEVRTPLSLQPTDSLLLDGAITKSDSTYYYLTTSLSDHSNLESTHFHSPDNATIREDAVRVQLHLAIYLPTRAQTVGVGLSEYARGACIHPAFFGQDARVNVSSSPAIISPVYFGAYIGNKDEMLQEILRMQTDSRRHRETELLALLSLRMNHVDKCFTCGDRRAAGCPACWGISAASGAPRSRFQETPPTVSNCQASNAISTTVATAAPTGGAVQCNNHGSESGDTTAAPIHASHITRNRVGNDDHESSGSNRNNNEKDGVDISCEREDLIEQREANLARRTTPEMLGSDGLMEVKEPVYSWHTEIVNAEKIRQHRDNFEVFVEIFIKDLPSGGITRLVCSTNDTIRYVYQQFRSSQPTMRVLRGAISKEETPFISSSVSSRASETAIRQSLKENAQRPETDPESLLLLPLSAGVLAIEDIERKASLRSRALDKSNLTLKDYGILGGYQLYSKHCTESIRTDRQESSLRSTVALFHVSHASAWSVIERLISAYYIKHLSVPSSEPECQLKNEVSPHLSHIVAPSKECFAGNSSFDRGNRDNSEVCEKEKKWKGAFVKETVNHCTKIESAINKLIPDAHRSEKDRHQSHIVRDGGSGPYSPLSQSLSSHATHSDQLIADPVQNGLLSLWRIGYCKQKEYKRADASHMYGKQKRSVNRKSQKHHRADRSPEKAEPQQCTDKRVSEYFVQMKEQQNHRSKKKEKEKALRNLEMKETNFKRRRPKSRSKAAEG